MATTRHITILAARFWPDRHGGVEQRLWHVSRALAADGWTVNVLTENRVNAPKIETVEPNLTVRRFDRLRTGRLWRLSDALKIRWWMNALKADPQNFRGWVWATDPWMAAAALLTGRRHHLIYNPAACTQAMHRVYTLDPIVSTMKCGRIVRWLDRLAYRLAHRVVVSSDNVRRQMESFYRRRDGVCIVPHGVDVPSVLNRAQARQRLGVSDEAWIVGFVGRLDPCKGLDFAMKAAAAGGLGDRGRLLIVGDGEDRARLQSIATELRIADRVIFAGGCDDPSSAYAAMDAFVMPSVYEAFGNVVLEAMAAGLPVIGRRHGRRSDRVVMTANDELITPGRTGLLVDPFDPTEMAAAMAMLRQDPELSRWMGRTAKMAATRMPWSAVVGRYAKILREAA